MGILNSLFKKPCAQFEKVSFSQYLQDWANCYEEDPDVSVLEDIYNKIELPKRGSKLSAGYDFTLPFEFRLKLGESITIPTGIRCKMDDSLVLFILPRSGQGFKYRLSVVNTVGVIDADYYGAKNEGHIMIKIAYDGNKPQTRLLHSKKSHKLFRDGDVILFLDGVSKPTLSDPDIRFETGKGYAQGIFLRYGRAKEVNPNTIRKGGFGSTN